MYTKFVDFCIMPLYIGLCYDCLIYRCKVAGLLRLLGLKRYSFALFGSGLVPISKKPGDDATRTSPKKSGDEAHTGVRSIGLASQPSRSPAPIITSSKLHTRVLRAHVNDHSIVIYGYLATWRLKSLAFSDHRSLEDTSEGELQPASK